MDFRAVYEAHVFWVEPWGDGFADETVFTGIELAGFPPAPRDKQLQELPFVEIRTESFLSQFAGWRNECVDDWGSSMIEMHDVGTIDVKVSNR